MRFLSKTKFKEQISLKIKEFCIIRSQEAHAAQLKKEGSFSGKQSLSENSTLDPKKLNISQDGRTQA
ncbi:hypothetical protein KSZ_14940 [Dictyobacter formicarum]|uniref:Uncharacterized protein n=1 Tax=Dictyobacter formicarum TaxID=2778368 RepID=A0ABQ3VCG7_9CHLR|nr:hypothetical protein KSZ_14940 [Dictyobacter formicarum]